MRVTFDFNLEAWIRGVDIEADSVEEAEKILGAMTFEELIEEGYVKDFNLSDVDYSVVDDEEDDDFDDDDDEDYEEDEE